MSASSYALLQYIAAAARRESERRVRAGGVVYVTAAPGFYPFLTVRDVLEYASARASITRRNAPALIERVLGATQLREKADSRVGVLSPAEIRTLALAEALVREPAVVLFDADPGEGTFAST